MKEKIVCVLGMHRSGSSYVAGRIRSMGIDFGSENELIAGDTYNARGYQENKELSYLGEEILTAFGGDHIRPPFLESGWEKSISLDSFRAKGRYLIDAKFGKSLAWGWKDPRNSLLLPFWRQLFHPTHYVVTIRNPLEVAESLLRRNGIPIKHGSELWFLHMASAIFHTRKFKRKLIFFEDACRSPLQFDRDLREFLSLDSNDTALDSATEFTDSLVHHRQTDEQVYDHADIHPLAKAFYRVLRELPRLNEDRNDFDSSHVGDARRYESLQILQIIETEPSLVINPWALPHCLSPKPKVGEYAISERNELIANLNQTLTVRENHRHELISDNEHLISVNERLTSDNEQLISVNERLISDDERLISDNERLISDNERLISVNERRISDDERLISDNERLISVNERLISDDERLISENKRLISDNERLADDSGRIISDNEQLRNVVSSLLSSLENFRQSKSWRLTHPLRVLSSVARQKVSLHSSNQYVYRLARVVGRKLPVAYSEQAAPETSIQPPIENTLIGGLNPIMRPTCCGLKAGLVSVVLPVFNQANLLAESIDSVLTQTYTNFELILINDGSTDGVEAVLEHYVDNPKVRIYSQANQKLSKALTNGFTYARGEYWTWTSADNIMEPGMLELLVRKLQSEPLVGMVYANYLAINDQGEVLKNPTWRAHNRPHPDTGEIILPQSAITLNTVQDNFIGPCFMYRGWIGRCIGDYDPQLGVEDYDYWMRINAFFRIHHLGNEAILYRYRVHENTLSANAHKHQIVEKAQILMSYEKERAEFCKVPLTYIVDDIGFDWLVLCGVDQQNIRNIEGISNLPTLKSALIIIGIKTLEKHLDLFGHTKNFLVIIFDDSATNYVKLKYIPSENAVVLAYDEKTTSRIRLVSDFPIFDAASTQSHEAIVAFYKNKHFMLSTRKKADLFRLRPEQLFSKKISRVLLQVDSFTQGGMENVVIDLAITLKKLGVNVSIAILGKEGEAAIKARDHDLEVTSFGSAPAKVDYKNYLKDNNIRLVNAHFSVYGAETCTALGIPFLQTIHNSYVWLDPQVIAKYQYADLYTTAYICVSATAARYADVALGLDVSKMKVIPNGLDPNAIEPTKFGENRENLRNILGMDSESPVFLNVASIIATKAQLPLINAFSDVLKTIPTARLVLLGGIMEPPYQRKIEEQIAALGVQKSVTVVGYDRGVAKYYHAADVFVLPSYWEGWSLSLGEAMVNGLPCVMTDVGSAYEFYGNKGTEVIQPPFGDITELNYLNYGQYIYGQDIEFEKRLADAMIRAAGKPRSGIDEFLKNKLDREIAYKNYESFFSEI